MKKIFTIIAGLTFCNPYAQFNLDWVKTMGSSNWQKAEAHVIDQSKNVYVVGYFFGTVDFDPSGNTFYLTSNGNQDIFIQKLDPQGNLVWAKSFGSTSSDNGKAIALDNYNNIVITGSIAGFTPTDLDPGTGTYMVNTGSSDHDNYFILKLNNNGNFIWAKTVGDPSGTSTYWDERGETINVDNNNNIIIGGLFGGIQDFDPGTGTYNLTSSNSGSDRNMFLHKLDENGNFVWAKSFGNNDMLGLNQILIDDNGNIYTSGYFQNTIDLDPSSSTLSLTSNGGFDVYMQKFNPNGNLLWARSLGNAGWDWNAHMSFDNTGNVLYSGDFYGTIDFDPGAGVINKTSNTNDDDMFILKLDPNGSFLWVQIIGEAGYVRPHVIDCDQQGNIYLAGDFYGTADFDPGSGSQNLTSTNGALFLLKLNSNGNFINVNGLFPPGSDGYINFGSITVSNDNQIILSGGFSDTVNMSTSGTSNIISNGDDDVFVVKYSQSNPSNINESFAYSDDRIIQRYNTIEIENYSSNEVIEVFNLSGEIIKKSNTRIIELNSFPKGVYIIALKSHKNEMLNAKKIAIR